MQQYAEQKKAHEAQLVQLAEQMGSIRIGLNPYVVKLQEHDVRARDTLSKCEGRVTECQRVQVQAEKQHQDALAAIRMRTSQDVYQTQSKLSVAQVAHDKAKRTLDDFLCGKLTHCPTCGQELPNKVDGSHLQADLENCATEVKALQSLLEEEKTAHSIAIDAAITQEQIRAQAALNECARALQSAQAELVATKQALSAERSALEEHRASYDASEASKSTALQALTTERAGLQQQIDALAKWLHEAAVKLAG